MHVSRTIIPNDLCPQERLCISMSLTDAEDRAYSQRVSEAFHDEYSFASMLARVKDQCHRVLATVQVPPAETWLLLHPDRHWTLWAEESCEGLCDGEYRIMMRHALFEHLYGVDAHETLAVHMLDLIERMYTAILHHEEAAARACAFHLGTVAEAARLKRRWGRDMLFGRDTRDKRKAANIASIHKRAADKQERVCRARRLALAAWNTDPPLRASLTQTAERITPQLNRLTRRPDEKPIRPQTVRSYLKNPEQWCTCRALQKNLCAADG